MMKLVIVHFLALTLTVDAFDPPAIFPASTRAALAEKSSKLNPSAYSTRGWSNRAATVLTPQSLEGVYTADRPFYWNKIDVGCRGTVIELPTSTDGKTDLWIHSPVALDGPMTKAMGELGNVKYIVSPNYEHVSFAKQWFDGFPDCEMWACPGLMERMPEIKWTAEIPEHYRPKGWKGGDGTYGDALPWDSDLIQPLHIDIEVNPLTGKPFFNEVIYYHAPSKALIVTDLFWNYPSSTIPNKWLGADDRWELAPEVEEVPIGSKLWKFGMDQVYKPFYKSLMVQDKSEYRAIVDHILNVWDVEMVIPAHGDILRGKDFIRKVFTDFFRV